MPAAVLVLVGIATANQRPTLTLKSVSVSPLSPSHTASPATSVEDTQWTVDISYPQPPWYRFVRGRSIRVQSAYIEDARGMRHL
jgi:hypothetical protein